MDQLHASTVPNLNVAGFWDQEDPWGPWQIFRHAEENDPDHTNFIVAGPWYHGEWHRTDGDKLGIVSFGGHDTSREFSANIEAPFFRYYLHDSGEKPAWQAAIFQTGSNTWHHYASLAAEAIQTNQPLSPCRWESHLHPAFAIAANAFRQYVSDPANPVPYRQRPISPTYPAGDWRTWEAADQRFVDNRPGRPYLRQLRRWTMTLPSPVALSAALYASTSGTDSDFVVKLIDVYPQDAQKNAWDSEEGPRPGQYAQSMNGYELPIAMEVRRGRYLESYEHPHPLFPIKRSCGMSLCATTTTYF